MPDTATIDFEPESQQVDFEPEQPGPPMPSVGSLIQQTQPWTSRASASAQIDQAIRPTPSPVLPPAQNRLSIAPPHQGTATQEVERQAGPPLTLQPTAKPTPLSPPPAVQNQITPVPRPAIGQPTLPTGEPAEPKQRVTLVSTGFGAPVWIANDGSIEGREEAARLNASSNEALQGATGVSGIPKVASGLKTLVPTATQPYPSARTAESAGAGVLGGLGEVARPAMVVGAAAAPITTIEAIIGSVGAQKGAEVVADRLHASPEAKALIGEAAATVGAIGGGISGAADERALANFKPIEDSLATLLWKRGFVDDAKGQQLRITSEADARAAAQAILKKNPVSFGDAVRIWRESRTQQPSTPVEGEYVGPKPVVTQPQLGTGQPPITRAEASEYLERTNYDPDAARELASRERAVKPVTQPPAPAPVVAPFASRPQIHDARTPAGPAAQTPEIDFTPETELARSEGPAKPAAVLPQRPAQQIAPAGKTQEVAKPIATPAPQRAEQVASAPSEPPPVHKFGNTQANIPEGSEAHEALETARARISDSDLAGQGKNVEGNHVTVRYGIQGDDTEGIKKFLSEQAPFEATLGKTDVFPPSKSSDGAAVVMAPIEAPELHRLNDEIQRHGDFAKSTHPDFRPHATVAYVKPEAANRYKGMSVTDSKKFTIDSVAIVHKDGTTEVVKLTGTKGGADASASKSSSAHAVEFEPENCNHSGEWRSCLG
ncbi:MAG TPA: 2'-5' RNA ligase family protein [Terriglobales bacterium]|nr:2'-5' RNA ligase family protein [Terriglobales bacterium]